MFLPIILASWCVVACAQLTTSSTALTVTDSSATATPIVTAIVDINIECDGSPCTLAQAISSSSMIAQPTSRIHVVDVGKHDQLLFDPIQVDASPGDTIAFRFHRFNHTVTESSLQTPCMMQATGFDSGFTHANQTTAGFVAFDVANSQPRWFYCRQTMPSNHCSAGMVFGLNPGPLMNQFLLAAANTDTEETVTVTAVMNQTTTATELSTLTTTSVQTLTANFTITAPYASYTNTSAVSNTSIIEPTQPGDSAVALATTASTTASASLGSLELRPFTGNGVSKHNVALSRLFCVGVLIWAM